MTLLFLSLQNLSFPPSPLQSTERQRLGQKEKKRSLSLSLSLLLISFLQDFLSSLLIGLVSHLSSSFFFWSHSMKKGKKVSMESSPYCPSSSSYSVQVGEEEAKARSRHRSLMLDYSELQKEIEAKRRKLTEANKKKHKLSAVVKFLQRKFKSLSKKPSQKIQVRIKKHSHKHLPTLNIQSKVPLKDSQEVREASVPSTTALFDLNQIVTSGDEMNYIEVEMGSSGTDLSNMTSVNGYVSFGAEQVAERRKIPWQDQMAIGA